MTLARRLAVLDWHLLLKSSVGPAWFSEQQVASFYTSTSSVLVESSRWLQVGGPQSFAPEPQLQQTASYKIKKPIFRMPAKIQEIVEAKLNSIEKIPDPLIPPPVPKVMTRKSLRVGVIAYKVGMTQDWNEHGVRVPLTVLWIDSCQVVGYKIPERDGHLALQVAAGSAKPKQMNPGAIGLYLKLGMPFKRTIRQFPVTPDALLPIGHEIRASHFVAGQEVDITGYTKYKGFQGVMKRWGFKGGPASHGVSLAHRTPGSIGAKGTGKVWKGKKLPGHMGDERRTQQKCVVYKIDSRRNLVFIRGAVPGPNARFVVLRDSWRTPWDIKEKWDLPFPAYLGEADPPVSTMKTPKDPYRPYREDTDYFEQKWKRSD